MNKVNLLLGRGSPRNYIPAVEENNPLLPCDRLIVKYYLEYPAYKIMRDYFLDHKEYTHLVLATDDIVVLPEHIEQLQKDLKKEDYPILSGIINVDLDDEKYINVCLDMPSKQRSGRKYKWMTRNILPEWDIFQVDFSGFPLMAIRRDVVEQTEFKCDRIYQGLPANRGASVDLVFCWECKENRIPIHVDQMIDMVHLRTKGGIMLGDKTKEVLFWPKGKDPISILT